MEGWEEKHPGQGRKNEPSSSKCVVGWKVWVTIVIKLLNAIVRQSILVIILWQSFVNYSTQRCGILESQQSKWLLSCLLVLMVLRYTWVIISELYLIYFGFFFFFFVFSCQYNETKVAEDLFFVQRESNEGTPIPRFKRARSMEPREFMVDVARSAERGKRIQRRREKLKPKSIYKPPPSWV